MVCQESPSPSPSETTPSLELLKFDSADSSPESSFRELDDAFLQTQTRIWLGEVLQIRLDEHPIISELLADGELLFQVSQVVWKLLMAKHMELRHLRAFKSQPFASKKNGWRYRPYSNVDSFLKMCKIVGLTGIDLFSPSDVVERRNTRRVCMCIRSFSKKSRSMNINVPDFDIVTCMVTMPKDVVGCIRRNIELSRSILADFSGYYLQKHAEGKSRQGYSVARSIREYEAYSNKSDDTEIKHSVLQCDGGHDDLCECNYTSDLNYNMMSPMVESIFIPDDLDHLDIQNQQRNEVSNYEFELLYSEESLQYHCSENIDPGYKLTWSSSRCRDLHIDSSDMTSDLDTRVERVKESRIMDLDYFEHDLLRGNESFNLHNDRNDQWNKVKKEYESQDTMKCKETAYSITSYARYRYFDEETEHSKCSPDCYFCKINSSDRAVSHSTTTSSTQLKNLLAYEDKESQVDLKSLHNASCDRSEELVSSQSYSLPEFCKWDQKGKCAMTSNRAKDNKNSACVLEGGSPEKTTPCKQNASEVLMSKVMLSCIPNKDVVSAAVVKLGNDGEELENDSPALASNALALGVDNSKKCPTNGDGANDFSDGVVTTQDIGVRGQRVLLHVISNDVVVPSDCDEDVSQNGSRLTNQSSKLECCSHQECQYNMDPVYLSEHSREVHIQEETKPEDDCVHTFENLVEAEEGSIEIPKGKPQKKLLLKSVLGGAAAVGLLFMVLHLRRRNCGEKDEQPRKASSHKGKEKIQKPSPSKVKRSATRGVYPAEKLKIK